MSKEEEITEEIIETFIIEDNDLLENISDSRITVQNLASNWTSLYDSNDSSSSLMITNENSILYWLQMLGIFLGSLLALAIITLITCRRPNKRVQVDI